MPLTLVHTRRARRAFLVAAAVATLMLFMAILASPAKAEEPMPEGVGEAPARAAASAPQPSAPPGPALQELEPAPTGEARTRWYGWQTLITDGAAAFLVSSATSGRGELAVAGVGAYALGGPLVHLSHRRPGAALGSLGARVGLPAMGVAAGLALEPNGRCRDFCVPVLPILLGALGIPAAMAIDSAVIAREPVEPANPTTLGVVQRLTPSVAPRREGGVDLALGGTF